MILGLLSGNMDKTLQFNLQTPEVKLEVSVLKNDNTNKVKL